MTRNAIAAEPYEFTFDTDSTAILVIDVQRDFSATSKRVLVAIDAP